MISLNALSDYLSALMNFDNSLPVRKIDPYMTNGLLTKGTEKIEKIAFAVSASLGVFRQAKKENCQAVIVHHSFNLPGSNHYDYIFQKRISFLLKNDISLFGYHFLLDAHPKIGNNVEILKVIGTRPDKPYLHHGDPWGYQGSFPKPKPLSEIKKSLKKYLSPRSVYYDFGSPQVSRVVAVSGKGAPLTPEITDLLNNKIDLYITGEVHEWNREIFREAAVNFIAGGHYHTERFGIRSLLVKVKKDLPQVTPVWLELKNEV